MFFGRERERRAMVVFSVLCSRLLGPRVLLDGLLIDDVERCFFIYSSNNF